MTPERELVKLTAQLAVKAERIEAQKKPRRRVRLDLLGIQQDENNRLEQFDKFNKLRKGD